MPFQVPPTISKPLNNDPNKSALQQMRACWRQTSYADANRLARECFEWDGGLAGVCREYGWGDRVEVEDLKLALEMCADLLDIAYSMFEDWPDEAELLRRGWTPPKGEDGQS